MARPASVQDVTTIDMATHGIGCDQASVESRVVVPATI